jgi:hypothetical protein
MDYTNTGGDRTWIYPHPNSITTNPSLPIYLLTEKMGKPTPNMMRIVVVTVLSWYEYLMLLSVQKKPL